MPVAGLQTKAGTCPKTDLGFVQDRSSWGPELTALHDPLMHRNALDLVQGSLHCSLLCRGVKIRTWLVAAT